MNPSQSIPEGVTPITVEGADLSRAIAAAAETMGTEAALVDFKFDLSHFRSSTGSSVAKRTVKILAWPTTKTEEEIEAEAKKRAERAAKSSDSRGSDRGDRRGRDRGERRGRDSRRDDRDDRKERRERRPRRDDAEKTVAKGPPEDLEDTEASTFAREWFTTLMGYMNIEGEVKSGGNDERVQLWVSAERAGRLIGKRGSTLGAIRHLLGLGVTQKFGDLIIDVDVEDNRPQNSERKPKRDRSRKPRGGGDRRGGDVSRYPEEKLRALARRAAEKAVESDKAITINLELNSYDRRIVHVEIAEIEGVGSRSEEREDGVKTIQVYPDAE